MVERHWLLNGVVALKTRGVLPRGIQRGNNTCYRIHTKVGGCQSSLNGEEKGEKVGLTRDFTYESVDTT